MFDPTEFDGGIHGYGGSALTDSINKELENSFYKDLEELIAEAETNEIIGVRKGEIYWFHSGEPLKGLSKFLSDNADKFVHSKK